jgi:outer membrane immunogenic protein
VDFAGVIMQRIVALAALIFGVGLGESPAEAVSVMAPPAAAFTDDWSGVYIGAHFGGAWQSAPDWTYFNPNNGARFSLTPAGKLGAAGGLQGGYNCRLAPRWLLGIEGDIAWISLAQTRTVPTIGPGSFATMSASNHWLASVRGRLGFIAWSNALFYVTGGAAWANAEYRGHMTRIIGASTFVADAASTMTKGGWVLGGGAERMIGQHVVLSLQYLYYSLDNTTLTGPISPGSFLPVAFAWSGSNVQVVRAGLSYRF